MARQSLHLPLGVGVIGCGNVSDSYFRHAQKYSPFIKFISCAARDVSRATAKAAQHGVKGCSVDELLADPAVQIVLNLTNPASHTAVNLAALRAGKHVYSEKPFAVNYAEGLKVLAESKKRRLRVGCAPDTVLGPGIQTCRKLIDDGAIGKPISATANFLNHGSEGWHPNPDFFYQPGGGPLFGGGPYHLSALVTMLGPVKSVSAVAKTTFKERFITSQPLAGQKINVRTPTHITALLEFSQGTVATLTMSFDVWAHHLPALEIHGTEGSLQCSDPFQFGGEVQVWAGPSKQWRAVPPVYADDLGRSLGLAEMAQATCERRPHRTTGEMALHVTEIMEKIQIAAVKKSAQRLKSTCRRPEPLADVLRA